MMTLLSVAGVDGEADIVVVVGARSVISLRRLNDRISRRPHRSASIRRKII